MKKILVAGATGYLGGFVAREFKGRGHFVRALVRSKDRMGPLRDVVDEVVEGEVTQPPTLEGVCDGMDSVFSSVGITRQKEGLTFHDVDYLGNRNLLGAALRSRVRKFVYVSVFGGPRLLHLDIVKAHEAFVSVLRASGLDYSVIRPTGFFSDMEAYLEMARRGRVYLFGDGRARINPIHGADLAVVCAAAADGGPREIDVGGPEILTHGEIAAMAWRVLGRPLKVTSVPRWIMTPVVSLTRLVNRHQGELLAFLTTAMSREAVAPPTGHCRLEDHFALLAAGGKDPGAMVGSASTRMEGPRLPLRGNGDDRRPMETR